MERKASAEKAVRGIRRKTRPQFALREKIRIVIEGLQGEESTASVCRREAVRVSASEKLELIRLVEGSSLSLRRTLAEIGLSRSTFDAWCERFLGGGPEPFEDRQPGPGPSGTGSALGCGRRRSRRPCCKRRGWVKPLTLERRKQEDLRNAA